jgi:hypothetical protein
LFLERPEDFDLLADPVEQLFHAVHVEVKRTGQGRRSAEVVPGGEHQLDGSRLQQAVLAAPVHGRTPHDLKADDLRVPIDGLLQVGYA